MNKKIEKIQALSQKGACRFFILAIFLGVITAVTAADMILPSLRGEFEIAEIPKNLSAAIEFLFSAVSSFVMAKALSNVSENEKLFDAKVVRTFKLSCMFLVIGGMAGGAVGIISSRFLTETQSISMEGLSIGLILCGLVLEIFVEYLYYVIDIQDELDTIA